MTKTNMRHMVGIAAFTCMGLIATPSFAQETATTSTNQVDSQTDWSVFTEASPKECWAVSAPKKSVNTKDGREVAVRRSEILLMVFFRPEVDVSGQIAFTGGYPFAEGQSVMMDIGGTKFALPVKGEWAWPASAADDAKIVAAMKRGAQAVLSGVSGRGTKTEDTVSLLGFTAAVEKAEQLCSG